MDQDAIQIHTSHELRLPADYDEVQRSSEYQNAKGSFEKEIDTDSGYYMLDESASTPLTRKTFFNEYSPPPPPLAAANHPEAAGKAKTLAAASTLDYELPIDAQKFLKSSTMPANFGNDDYETPLDASL